MIILSILFLLTSFWREIESSTIQASFPVHYASWFKSYDSSQDFVINNFNFTLFNWTDLFVPSTTDDNPYQVVKLPFEFPLLGVNQYVTYVGANGNIIFDTFNIPPCNAFCVPVYQHYYGSINGLCSDWNPSQAAQSVISYYASDNDIFFRFYQLEYYGFSFSKNTFYIRLSSDGGVRIYYDTITLPSQIQSLYPTKFQFFPKYLIPVRDGIISGIREYSNLSYPAYYSMTTGQRTDMISWNQTKINGIYPNLNLLKCYSVWKACPISDLWCMNMKSYNLSSSSNTLSGFNATLSTITTISCQSDYIAYQCSIKMMNGSDPNLIITTPGSLSSNTSVQCEFTSAALVQVYTAFLSLGSSYDYVISYIGIRAALSTDSYVPGNIDTKQTYVDLLPPSIPFLFVNMVKNASAAPDGSCAVTTAISLGTSCDECDICNQSYTCLYNETSCPVLEDPYSRTNCANNCSYPDADEHPYDLQSLYLPDKHDRCCLGSTIDCNGECGGSREIGLADSGGVLDGQPTLSSQSQCCNNVDCLGACNGNAITDCAGVCQGLATYDDCGICSGGTTGVTPSPALQCIPKVEISPFAADIPILYNITYDTNLTQENASKVFVITVKNPSEFNVTITVAIQETTANPVDPLIITSPDKGSSTLLKTNETLTITASISLYRLLTSSDNVTSWEVKYIGITSQRFEFVSTATTILIPVDPMVFGCEMILSRTLCSASPMCGFCYLSDSYRVLREVDNPDTHKRRLFDRVVPSTLNPVDDDIYGYCVSSDTSLGCQRFPSLTLTDDSKYFWWIIVFTVPMVMVVLIFLFSLWKQI